ncbi:hypothetical protein [Nitrococcus mobilis]|uniref:Uncharacterized protein n=1 Tax=Nitrococcus mobilis Nb-231 TaxID=314278 RepID=A4BTJ7_9GAMM|nr:hypothetical protein NB231_00170 [Nitrococcus mobilis Nb-231]
MQRPGGGKLGGSQTREHGVAGEPEEEVGVRLLEGERHELGVGRMSVAVQHQRAAVEGAAHGESIDGRETQRLWGRIRHGRPRLTSSEEFLAEHPLYQWVK